MSLPQVAETAPRPGPLLGLEARLAVTVARPLALLSPARLRRVLHALSRGARPATPARALRSRQATVAVSVRCAGLGCLQRSVATALMCRLHGQWPDWCSGFRTRPFGAHAWVEADGAPIGEGAGIGAFRTVLAVRHPSNERRTP